MLVAQMRLVLSESGSAVKSTRFGGDDRQSSGYQVHGCATFGQHVHMIVCSSLAQVPDAKRLWKGTKV